MSTTFISIIIGIKLNCVFVKDVILGYKSRKRFLECAFSKQSSEIVP